MISSHFDKMVTALLGARDFRLFEKAQLRNLPEHTVRRFVRAAETALRAKIEPAGLADWLESADPHTERYDEKRRAMRSLLVDLCLGEAVTQRGRYLKAAAERIFAILSEPCWNRAGRRTLPCAPQTPDIFCAQTAEILAWAAYLLEENLDEIAPGLADGLHFAVENRAVSWLDDPACCESALRSSSAPSFARAMGVACLFTPQDESVRWLRFKNALRIADRCIEGDWLRSAWKNNGLHGWMRGACALSDLILLTDFACEGRSGLRADEDIFGEMSLPAVLQISEQYFADEKNAMRPEVFGEDCYRIGATFDDDAMCALGVQLDSLERAQEADPGAEKLRASENITSRMLNALWRQSLESESAKPAEGGIVQAPEIHFYAARPHAKGFYAALLGGAPVLFADGKPIVALSPLARSMPEIEGIGPARVSCRDRSIREEGFATISMDIAPAYGAQAALASWQRTLMVINRACAVRILDAFDFSGARKRPAIRFVCAEMPVIAVGAPRARIGQVQLEWEGPTKARMEEHTGENGEKSYSLLLERDEAVAGGCWTTTFALGE